MMQTEDDNAVRTSPAGLSRTVKALGLVSLCTDISSEMVYAVNPIFLTKVLGAPAWVVGLIEGIAESTASILKLYSGYLSDRAGKRKGFALLGYGLAAAAKPLMVFAGSWGDVLAARFIDRTGKGLRTAPRDALITENCAPDMRGRAFGLHRSMDTTGAVLGPLFSYFFLKHHANPDDMRLLYALSCIPAVIGVLCLAFFVREAVKAAPKTDARPPRFTLAGLSPEYRTYLFIVALFGLGNSSDAFLILRAQSVGMTLLQMVLLYTLFNVVEALLGYSAGRLSDRVGRKPLLVAGYLVFAGVYLGFALLHSAAAVWPLFLLYGLYYTLTQGAQKALAADFAHKERLATEMGAFHMVVGLAALPASLIAGWLFKAVAPAAPFFVGAATATLAAALLLVSLRPGRRPASA
jgi:MFS family permease